MDKKTLFAFLMIALILMLIPYYYRLIGLAPSDEQQTAPSPRETQPSSLSVPPPERAETQPSSDTTSTLHIRMSSALPQRKKEIYVETNLYTATISSLGAGTITSFLLKNYRGHKGAPVNLIRQGLNSTNPIIQFKTPDGELVTLDQPGRLISRLDDGDTLFVTADKDSISFYYDLAGVTISKTLVFSPTTYLIDVALDLSQISRTLISQEQFTLRWLGGLPTTESNIKDDVQYFAAHLYQGDELTKHNGKSGNNVTSTGRTAWTALRSKYFTAAFIPRSASNYGELLRAGDKISTNKRLTPPVYHMAVGLSSKTPVVCSLYLGPLKYSAVRDLHVGLEKTMNFGWSFIRWISKGVLFLLVSMHKVVPNYGVLLIIFSIVVKIIVYPLTRRSYQSTKEMQAIQPLILQLREKYKGDSQRLNQETMKLYKEHGVNPLGGCLPMLLQMPLLFALFIVFRTTIELRGAPFLLWIRDLSAPDTIMHLPFSIPIYGNQVAVLPILMAISIFIQQKMTGAQAQAQQKYMMYFMSLFFFLLFNNFPSGLNLYYTLFNVLTILQQKYLVSPGATPSPVKTTP